MALLYSLLQKDVKWMWGQEQDEAFSAAKEALQNVSFPTRKLRWIVGTIVKITGPLLYEVELMNGLRVRRHVDGVRRREEEITFL